MEQLAVLLNPGIIDTCNSRHAIGPVADITGCRTTAWLMHEDCISPIARSKVANQGQGTHVSLKKMDGAAIWVLD
jgi:hypothetical protein